MLAKTLAKLLELVLISASTNRNKSLVDIACGTGDIGKLYLDNTDINNHITCIDPNKGMITKGKEKLKNYKNIKWIISSYYFI